MTSLGDVFPRHIRDQYIDRAIRVGAVVRLPVAETNPPKIKRVIVVGINETHVGVVFINTDINTSVIRTQELLNHQIPIPASRNGCVDHDSYADCSFVFPKTIEEISNLLRDGLDGHDMGELNPEDMRLVITTVLKSRLISTHTKRAMGIIKAPS